MNAREIMREASKGRAAFHFVWLGPDHPPQVVRALDPRSALENGPCPYLIPGVPAVVRHGRPGK